MAPIENVDISSAAFKANPYPFYAQLRDEAPVHRITLGDKRPAWLVTRYEDVVTVLKDDRFVKDKRNVMSREQIGERAVDSENAQADRAQHARRRCARPYPAARAGAHGVHAAAGREHARAHPATDRRATRWGPGYGDAWT